MKWLTNLFDTIRGRLLFGTLGLALIPLIVAGAGLLTIASQAGRDALQARAVDQLQSLRTVKTSEIGSYFGNLQKTMLTLAANPVVVDAMHHLDGAYPTVGATLTVSPAEQRAQVTRYFTADFAQEYAKRNNGEASDMAPIVATLPDATVALQYLYIARNQAPLGSKNQLDAAPEDSSAYSVAHRALHPYIRQLYEQFGFYDFFLVNPDTGNIVYTFFKEADYGTSLLSGPYAKTKLGEAFAAARTATDPHFIYLSDFAPYLPSYEDEASFISTPIFDGDKRIGVLIAQVPIDQINQVMTFAGKWKESGFGASGEAYLVGPDRRPRSVSRFLLEDAKGFGEALAKVGVEKSELDAIAAKKSNVGLMQIDTEGVRQALGGAAGVATYPDYRKIPVLGAYAPIDVLGLKWAILSEIDAAEAFQPVEALRNLLLKAGLVILVVLALIGFLIARRLSASINTPLAYFQGVVQAIAGGESSARVKSKSHDEVGELSRAFDQLLDERVATLEAAAKENEELNNSVVTIMQSVGQLAQRDLTIRVPVTADVTGAVSDAINLMTSETSKALKRVSQISQRVAGASKQVSERSDAVQRMAQESGVQATTASTELAAAASALQDIAQQAQRAAGQADRALKTTGDALDIVRATVEGISASRDQIRETEKRVKRLGERSQEISSVVNIIGQIAERTSVLALNASMQAVAAGDAGRGFAVVADEVKRLAENARQATQQISGLVSAIQADAAEATQAMNRTITEVVDISRLADQAGGQMTSTRAATEDLVNSVRSISSTSEAQGRVAGTLVQRARDLVAASERTLGELLKQRDDTQALGESATQLLGTVGEFRLPGA